MTLILKIFSKLPITSLVLCLDLLSTPSLPSGGKNASAHTQRISHFQIRVLLLINSSVIAKEVGERRMISVQI